MPVHGATSRICATCASTPLTSAVEIRAGEHDRLYVAGKAQPGDSVWIAGNYRLTSLQHPPLEAGFPAEVRVHNGTLRITLKMPLEQYVAAVVAAEGAQGESSQSLQAVSVAVRTFAVRFRGRHKAEGFDFCDATHCQVVHPGPVSERVRAAVQATRGELLWYEGRPAATYYHQNCGGSTADVAEVWQGPRVPYLQEHADPYCSRTTRNAWRSVISRVDLSKALELAGMHISEGWTALQVESRSLAGRVWKLRFEDATGAGSAVVVSASDLRMAVDRALGWNQIRSDVYDLQASGDQIVFRGRGSGHGVGLCQKGAAEMGKEGKSYREILSFYYPGTVLSPTAQGMLHQPRPQAQLTSAHTGTY